MNVEYIPRETVAYSRPASIMISFPDSGVAGFGVSVEDFAEFVAAARRGDFDEVLAEHERRKGWAE